MQLGEWIISALAPTLKLQMTIGILKTWLNQQDRRRGRRASIVGSFVDFPTDTFIALCNNTKHAQLLSVAQYSVAKCHIKFRGLWSDQSQLHLQAIDCWHCQTEVGHWALWDLGPAWL